MGKYAKYEQTFGATPVNFFLKLWCYYGIYYELLLWWKDCSNVFKFVFDYF